MEKALSVTTLNHSPNSSQVKRKLTLVLEAVANSDSACLGVSQLYSLSKVLLRVYFASHVMKSLLKLKFLDTEFLLANLLRENPRISAQT